MTDRAVVPRVPRPAGALLSDDSWQDRKRLLGRRIVSRDWTASLGGVHAWLRANGFEAAQLPEIKPSEVPEWQAAAVAVTAWASPTHVIDGWLWHLPPPRYLHQPWRALAYHLAVVHLGARKACVARAGCVTERAVNFACARIERDRDDEGVDATLMDLEALAGLAMLRHLGGLSPFGLLEADLALLPVKDAPWLAALNADVVAALLADELALLAAD